MAQHMRLKHPGVAYNMADLNPDTPPPPKIEVYPVKKERSWFSWDANYP